MALFLAAGCGRACSGKAADVPSDSGGVVLSSAAPEAAAPVVDLLYATNSIVAVSSRVDNPRDIPDHLVDHKEETAWNGKTNDLVGAWIAFRVPEDANVAYVMMSTGFDKKTAKEDLFLENHRVRKVRIRRGKDVLKEATLDIEERRPQRIDIGSKGGDFQIEVLEVEPGTKKLWKEITVSELGVFGTPGKRLKPKPGPPLVRVGSLDIRDQAYDDSAGPTYAAACAAFVKDDHEAALESLEFFIDAGLGEPPDPGTCTAPSTVTKAGHGSILETAHVHVSDAYRTQMWMHFEGDVLALRTPEGVKVTNIRLSGDAGAYYSKFTYKLLSESWVGDQLVIQVEQLCVTDSDGYAPPGHEDELHSEVTTVMRTVCEASSATCTTIEDKK